MRDRIHTRARVARHGLACALLALAAVSLPAAASASAMQACMDRQLACQAACSDGPCVQRCGDQASRCMAAVTGARPGGANNPGGPGIKPHVPLPRSPAAPPVAPAKPAEPAAPTAERPPHKCIVLDTWSEPGLAFMVNRCAVALSVSYCFTEGPFLNCGQARPGHVTVGALNRQTVKAGQGTMHFAYDFEGRLVNLCQASPATCGLRAGQAGAGGTTSRVEASAGPGGTMAARAGARPAPRRVRTCRAFDAQGLPIRLPQHEIDAAIASGMAARKTCVDQLCRYHDAQGREVDTAGVERLTWGDMQRLRIDPQRTVCQRAP